MDQATIVTLFAGRYVREAFRERFVHEAMRRPIDLHRRICHEIEKVFDTKYEGQAASFKDDDDCLFLGWSWKITRKTWKEAREEMPGGGGGYLVIKADASSFYAETEAYPAIVYAGGG